MNIHKLHQILTGISAINCSIIVARMAYEGHLHGAYLIWNLLLAAIPFYISWLIAARQNSSVAMRAAMFVAWLLFLPNAPYIITDLVHLGDIKVLRWYDVFIIFSFAINGLLYGVCSIYMLKTFYSKYFLQFELNILQIIVCAASGYGVYIGRCLRWNSWSVITHPLALLKESARHMYTTPMAFKAWAFTGAVGMVLLASLFVLENLQSAMQPMHSKH
ncbi:MAG: hypothetical protein RL660_2754 [Bacteroidota bacterium]